MRRNECPVSSEPTEAEIQHLAYQLWLQSGQVHGRDVENWLAAKEMLRHRRAPQNESRGRRRRAPLSTHFPAGTPASHN